MGKLGYCYFQLEEYKRALNCYKQALKTNREIGYKEGEGLNLTNIGSVYIKLNDHLKAISFLESALKITAEIGDKKNGLLP